MGPAGRPARRQSALRSRPAPPTSTRRVPSEPRCYRISIDICSCRTTWRACRPWMIRYSRHDQLPRSRSPSHARCAPSRAACNCRATLSRWRQRRQMTCSLTYMFGFSRSRYTSTSAGVSFSCAPVVGSDVVSRAFSFIYIYMYLFVSVYRILVGIAITAFMDSAGACWSQDTACMACMCMSCACFDKLLQWFELCFSVYL